MDESNYSILVGGWRNGNERMIWIESEKDVNEVTRRQIDGTDVTTV